MLKRKVDLGDENLWASAGGKTTSKQATTIQNTMETHDGTNGIAMGVLVCSPLASLPGFGHRHPPGDPRNREEFVDGHLVGASLPGLRP